MCCIIVSFAPAEGLDYIVLDELHTYRGRQGADVAMLVRRIRDRLCRQHEPICIGTSVASRLFGTAIGTDAVIDESLERAPIRHSRSWKRALLSPAGPFFFAPHRWRAFAVLAAADAWMIIKDGSQRCGAQFPKWLGCVVANHESLSGSLIAAGGALFAAWVAWHAVRDQIDSTVRPLANIMVGDYEDHVFVEVVNNGTGPMGKCPHFALFFKPEEASVLAVS